MRRAIVAAAFALFVPRIASAACEGEPPKNDVAVYPLSFTTRAIGAEYERFVAPPRLSVAGGLALRGGALADYSSTTVDAGAELRFWIWPGPPFGCLGDMEGPYAGLRVDVAYTRVDERATDRFVGSNVALRETLAFGYRFVFWRKVYIAPFAGPVVTTDFDPRGRLASASRFTATGGFAVGWLF